MCHFLTVISLTSPEISKNIASIGQASINQSSTSIEEIDQVKLLINHLIQWTEDKLNQLTQIILADFQSINIDELYEKKF